MVDYDGDGVLDLVVGSFDGFVYFAKGRGGIDFEKAVMLKGKDGKGLNGGSCYDYKEKGWAMTNDFPHVIHPRFVDWDDDGDLDYFAGGRGGMLLVRLNQAGAKKMPEFAAESLNITVDGRLRYELKGRYGSPAPVVLDWDADGLKDLIILDLRTNRIFWHRNVGKKGNPGFGAERLLLEYKPGKNGPKKANRLDVADFNGDGRLDLIVGGGYLINGSQDDSGAWVYLGQ